MNCLECQEILQRFLDGEPLEPLAAKLDDHLAVCSECRDLFSASRRLVQGIRLLVRPVPGADLATRISTCGLVELRRMRRNRRLLLTGALAASISFLAFALYSGFRWPSSPAGPGNFVQQDWPKSPGAPVSLQRSVEEASTAVALLTRRTTNETVGQTRLLLPVVLPEPLLADTELVQEALKPPTQSLREVRQGMSEGLEPVTTSARRAVDLFLRELPPMQDSMQ